MDTINCKICGKQFVPASYNGKYCSKECSRKGVLIKRKEWKERNKEHVLEHDRQRKKIHYYQNLEQERARQREKWRRLYKKGSK